jgi:hypothetical protein
LQDYLELNGFFIFLFFVSDVYFLFIIYQVVVATFGQGKHLVVENDKVDRS